MASFPLRILAVSIPGLLAGLFFNATRTTGLTSGALNLVVTARYVLSQLITFLAPVIILGLMASSIISIKKEPAPVTGPVIQIAYGSMLGAAAFSAVLGYLIIPKLQMCIRDSTGHYRLFGSRYGSIIVCGIYIFTNLIYNIHPLRHMSKSCILSVQIGTVRLYNKELRCV